MLLSSIKIDPSAEAIFDSGRRSVVSDWLGSGGSFRGRLNNFLKKPRSFFRQFVHFLPAGGWLSHGWRQNRREKVFAVTRATFCPLALPQAGGFTKVKVLHSGHGLPERPDRLPRATFCPLGLPQVLPANQSAAAMCETTSFLDLVKSPFFANRRRSLSTPIRYRKVDTEKTS